MFVGASELIPPLASVVRYLVTVPAAGTVAVDVSHQRAASQHTTSSLTAVQEEYRKYRIRCETLLRQKDDEIETLSRKAKSQMYETSSSRDLEEKLAAAEQRIQKLARSKAELQEQVGRCTGALTRRALESRRVQPICSSWSVAS